MKIIGAIVMTVILMFTLVLPSSAELAGSGNPSFIITEASIIVEKVVDVNYKARTVTLKDDEGKVRTVKVSEQVRNFNQVKQGDVVTIEVNETVSVEVQPGPGDTMNIASESQSSAAPGAKPSSTRTIEGKLKTRVEAIDYEARTVTFKNRKGVLTTYKVGEQAKRFNEIRRNDMLVIEYSQTVAVSVK